MCELLVRRTASLTGAGLVLGLIGLGAASMSYSVRLLDLPDPPVLPYVIEAPPPDPPKPPETPPPPPQSADPAPADAPLETASLALPPAPTLAAPSGAAQGPVLIERPHWLERPRNLARHYPARTLERGVEGVVTLDCLVTVEGRLVCAVASETPSGWGFAQAALRIAAEHRMIPATRSGIPVEGRYRMRVPFRAD